MTTVVQFPTRKPPAPVVGVGSGKGGVGKTWLALTLAKALADTGERVLLVDGDLGLANVDIQLALSPVHDLAHVVSGEVALPDAVVRVAGGAAGGLQGRGGFDLIPCHSGSPALADLAPARVQKLAAGIAALSFSYDRIIVDLGAGVADGVMRLAAACDNLLVVALNEPTSLTDAYAFIKLLRTRNAAIGVGLVANRVRVASDARHIHGAIAKSCTAWLGFEPPLSASIREDATVRSAIRSQTLLAQHAPQSKALADVSALADAIKGRRAFLARIGAANEG
jgi:flagellar biosynthesis protein FlhG